MVYAQDIIRSIIYKLSDLPLNLYKDLNEEIEHKDYEIIFLNKDESNYISFISNEDFITQRKETLVNLIEKVKEIKRDSGNYTEEDINNTTNCRIYKEQDSTKKYLLNATDDAYKYEELETIPDSFNKISKYILDLQEDTDIKEDKVIINIVSNYSVPKNGVLTEYYTRVDLSLYTFNDTTGEKTNKLILDMLEKLQRNFIMIDENKQPTKNILYVEDRLSFNLTEFNKDGRVSLGTLLIKNY